MADLKGRTVLVTGGNSGIGLAIAQRLAREGAGILLSGIVAQDEGNAASAQLAATHGVVARYLRADMRVPAEIEQLIRQAEQHGGGAIDILVNNAGMQHTSAIESFPVDIWNDMVAVNLSASFHTIRLCLPAMRARGWGRIVNVASISGLRGRAGKSAYNATKHGLIGLTKAVALETADTAITCNAICPGWAHTALVQRQVEALAQREQIDVEAATRMLISLRQPSGRFVRTEDLAAMVAFLCGEQAQEVRGAAWTMDGGTTAL
ncbi:3-hydroxybutyrate dehydrogenase [Ottowia thiooxydans]|uniref:3-hydroxybutyrate dehydrogenase n=1 Tax=Ottowia thiooxydans TaxID=219182 RepID=UPI0003FED5C1|nr:3-hydroxybutyrate dehydrogenase [Ottowia thiooxydans]